MKQITLTAFYVESVRGKILVTVWQPTAPLRGCVLVVPPFAEEMNKCRRMIAEAAYGLAKRGVATVLPDLFGTGDSQGEFAEADWGTWLQDLGRAAAWSDSQGLRVTDLLGIRTGSELAARATEERHIPLPDRVVLWQPVFDCNRFLQQFLRLRIAAQLMQTEGRETVEKIRATLSEGRSVEVAGYELSPRLADELGQCATRHALPSEWARTRWFELARDANTPLPLPSQRLIDATIALSREVVSRVVAGEPFWNSTEIVCNSEMIDATIETLA